MNTTYSQTSTSFAFHTNKKQYLDTLHIQKKTEMRRRKDNNSFYILFRIVHKSQQFIKNIFKKI